MAKPETRATDLGRERRQEPAPPAVRSAAPRMPGKAIDEAGQPEEDGGLLALLDQA